VVLQWSWGLIIWLPAFFLSGALLKFLDSVSDRLKLQNGSKKSIWLTGLLGSFSCAIIFLWVSSASYHFAALYTGIVLGVLLVGKVYSPFFLLGTVTYFIGIFLIGLAWPINALWSALFVLIFSALDELGHNFLENHPSFPLNTPILVVFLKYRFLLKVGVLGLFVVGWLDGVAAVGLWLFDLAYVFTDYLSVTR
jgi:hypothetical protein